MMHRGLDIADDWVFGKGRQSFASGLTAIGLNIKTRLRSWKGNCFFATQDGVDWNNFLDIGTKSFLDRDILRTILQSDGVVKVIDYSSEIVDRELNVDATIQTVFGKLFLQEALS